MYAYDAVGNRLSKSVTGVSGVGTTLVNGTTGYAYDANDRITAQNGPAGASNHSYDADGNERMDNHCQDIQHQRGQFLGKWCSA